MGSITLYLYYSIFITYFMSPTHSIAKKLTSLYPIVKTDVETIGIINLNAVDSNAVDSNALDTSAIETNRSLQCG
jgi:hypothetical protein